VAQVLIHSVPTKLVPDLWSGIEHFVDEACSYHPFMESNDVMEVLLWGKARLFIATDGDSILGFAAMEVVEYPKKRVANVFLCGGVHGFLDVAVEDLLPVLQRWGKDQNVEAFSIIGRPGWVRALKAKGFKALTHATLWQDFDVEGRRKQQHTASDEHFRAVEGSATLSH
jgi:hypothetical protein